MICYLVILEFENKALSFSLSLLAQILEILLYKRHIFSCGTVQHTHEPTSVKLINEGAGSSETSERTHETMRCVNTNDSRPSKNRRQDLNSYM